MKKKGKKSSSYKPPYRRSRSYSPNIPSGIYYRNPSPVVFHGNRPPSRSRRGGHANSAQKTELKWQDGEDRKSHQQDQFSDAGERKKDSGYGSRHSGKHAGRKANCGDKSMGRRNYPDRSKKCHSAERSSSPSKKDYTASGRRSKSAEKLRLEKIRQEAVEDSSLTSTSQCSTENSGNGKSTEADGESSLDELTHIKGSFVDQPRDGRGYRGGNMRHNKSFDHVRELEPQETMFNRSLPPILSGDMALGMQHLCNVSAGSSCSSKSDHVLQWLQQNARQGILTAAPPPPPAPPGHTLCSAAVAAAANPCLCTNCRPPGSNTQEMSTKLLAVLQQGSVQTVSTVNPPPPGSCQYQGMLLIMLSIVIC